VWNRHNSKGLKLAFHDTLISDKLVILGGVHEQKKVFREMQSIKNYNKYIFQINDCYKFESLWESPIIYSLDNLMINFRLTTCDSLNK